MKRLLLATLVSLGLLGIVYAAEIEDLDTTDASNTARFPEGMAPSAVNNGARALEGLLARFYNDLGCRISTAGSSNAYTLAASQAVTSYFDGLILCFDASFPNTSTTPTLNVDSLGAQTIQRNGGELTIGAIEKDQKVLVVYDGTNFEVLSVARAVTSASDVITTEGDLVVGDSSGGPGRVAIGVTDGSLLRSNATTAVWTDVAATQALLEAAVAITSFSTPGRQQHHPSAAKAWVYFEGDAATPDSTKVGYNIGTIVDNGTGSYTVPFITNQSTPTYPVATNGGNTAAGTDTIAVIVSAVDVMTGSFRLDAEDATDNSQVDPGEVSAIVMGDL